ncbi:MAG: DHH family phosphoesterase [Promethearchaeota archaeon]
MEYFKEKYLIPYNNFINMRANQTDGTPAIRPEQKVKNDNNDTGNNGQNDNGDSDVEFFGSVYVYSHLDADGLSAASIMGLALQRENVPFQITILKQLEEQYFEEINQILNELNKNNFVIFTDFGSGQINLFKEYIQSDRYIILDHHEPLKSKKGLMMVIEEISGYHANAYLGGLNGSSEISGAGMAYLFSRILNSKNNELAYIAIIGAIGDLQHKNKENKLIGMNATILEEATKLGLITIENEPLMSRSKSLGYALAYTLPIKVPGISGNIQNANRFLSNIGINLKTDLGDYKTLADLTMKEKTTLTSKLLEYSINQGVLDPFEGFDKIVGSSILLTYFSKYPEVYDATDFARVLNACGRMNKASVGLAACMIQRRDYIQEAIKIAESYTNLINQGIKYITESGKNNLIYRKNIIYFKGDKVIPESVVGVICSHLVFSGDYDTDKVILGVAESDPGYYKISARAHKNAIRKGVNLSSAIRSACEQLGINEKGGGHPAASGAKIPQDKLEDFLDTLEDILVQQKESSQKHLKKT